MSTPLEQLDARWKAEADKSIRSLIEAQPGLPLDVTASIVSEERMRYLVFQWVMEIEEAREKS